MGYFTCDIFGEYRCEKFGRIFHMWCILSNISWLWRIRWKFFTALKNSMELLTCAIFGQMSNRRHTFDAFFTCDVFCPISHNLYELGRFFHSRVVYYWSCHVWHNRSNILHETLSANIGVRNSVGFFTCYVFCWICDNFNEFGQMFCEVFDRIPHVWHIRMFYIWYFRQI